MGETIFLTANKSEQNVFSRGLDILSSVLLEPTTFIKSPTRAGELVRERRKKIRRGDTREAIDVIAETLTATAIGAVSILGAGTVAGRAAAIKLVKAIAPTTPLKAFRTVSVGGVLLTSPKAREFVGSVIEDPTRIGRRGGEVIEKVVSGEDPGSFLDVVKTAGVIGAGAVIAGGVVKGIGVIKDRFATPGLSPGEVPTSIALPVGKVPIQEVTTPSSAPVITPTKEPGTQVPSVVVNTNIKINNRSSANRRFINNVHV